LDEVNKVVLLLFKKNILLSQQGYTGSRGARGELGPEGQKVANNFSCPCLGFIWRSHIPKLKKITFASEDLVLLDSRISE